MRAKRTNDPVSERLLQWNVRIRRPVIHQLDSTPAEICTLNARWFVMGRLSLDYRQPEEQWFSGGGGLHFLLPAGIAGSLYVHDKSPPNGYGRFARLHHKACGNPPLVNFSTQLSNIRNANPMPQAYEQKPTQCQAVSSRSERYTSKYARWKIVVGIISLR